MNGMKFLFLVFIKSLLGYLQIAYHPGKVKVPYEI